jgi:hypothetical protein
LEGTLKKQLLTTTALVVAGALATSGAALAQKKSSRPSLSIGGHFEAGIGAVDDNGNGANGRHIGVDVFNDSELRFDGRVTLDNGIRIRSRTEMDFDTDDGGVDEASLTISGGFGSLVIGGNDAAAQSITTGALGHWATNVGQNTAFDVADWVETPAGHAASTVNRVDAGDGDASKFTYFTPTMNGLMLGISYIPSSNQGNNSAPESHSSAAYEGYSAGLRYRRKVGNAGIDARVGYVSLHEPGTGVNQERPGGVGGGLIVDVGNIRAAFGYTHDYNLSAETAATNSGDESYDFGLRYTAGRNAFSLGYMQVSDEATKALTAEEQSNVGMLSYRRTLGPGVQYRLNFMWAEYEGETAGSTDDNDGIALVTSVRIAF